MNMHSVNPGIKIHTVVSEALDFDHDAALIIPMGEVSDDQLLAEVFLAVVVLQCTTLNVNDIGC